MNRVIKTLLTLLLSVAAFGATPVTFTGLVQSTAGTPATSGYVQFDLTPQNQGIAFAISGTSLLASQTGRCGINNAGQVLNSSLSGPCLIWGNDVITPGNSLYKITVAPSNKPANTFNNVLIFGTTVDLSNLTFINPTPVVGQELNFSPLVSQTISPGLDSVWTLGQPSKRYATGYFNTVTGRDITTPQPPSTGEIGYFKANSGWCSLDSSGVERCIGAPPTPITCNTPGAIVIQQPSGSIFVCDLNITTDGAGNFSVVTLSASGGITGTSFTTTGPGGLLKFKAQAPPTIIPGGEFDLYIDNGTGLLGCRNTALTNCINALQQVVSGSTVLPATAVAANNGCNVYSSTATGATTSNGVIPLVHGTDVAATTGYAPGQLIVYPPFTGTNLVSIKVCNPTNAIITPSAVTVFWVVI